MQSQKVRAGGNAWKWWLTGVLFLATVLTYLDRQTLAICEKMVREELHLNDEQYGRLLSAFRWAYALMQLPAGMMADRLPLRSTFGLAVGLWSLAGAAAAAAFRVPILMVTRGVLGMGESFNWPCAVANCRQHLSARGPQPGQRHFQQRRRVGRGDFSGRDRRHCDGLGLVRGLRDDGRTGRRVACPVAGGHRSQQPMSCGRARGPSRFSPTAYHAIQP